jgi:hypothetical protein
MTTEAEAAFEVSTYDQSHIEDNANERFGLQYGDPHARAAALAAGFINDDAEITPAGWQQLNKDGAQLENNALKWLKKTFIHVRDDGHSNTDALVGALWFDPTDKRQAELIELASASPGRSERIDMNDASYGDLAYTAFNGVSDFGSQVLGGAINFSHVEEDVWEIIEATLAKPSSRPGVKFDLDGVRSVRAANLLPSWARQRRR